MAAKPPSRYPSQSSASETPFPDCSRSSCTLGERRNEVFLEHNDSRLPLDPIPGAPALALTCSEDRSATSTSPVAPADTADKTRCWGSTTAACFARSQLANSAGRTIAVGASVGSTADADACSVRAAARTVDSGDGSDSDEATAEDSGSSDLSATSHYPLDAAARIDRAVFALACLVPEPINRLVNNKLPLSREYLSAFCMIANVLEIYFS